MFRSALILLLWLSRSTPQWTGGGVAVGIAAEAQTLPRMVGDTAGGAILTWRDPRVTGDPDLYAARVFGDGALPVVLSVLELF